jgi:hypothetical protein
VRVDEQDGARVEAEHNERQVVRRGQGRDGRAREWDRLEDVLADRQLERLTVWVRLIYIPHLEHAGSGCVIADAHKQILLRDQHELGHPPLKCLKLCKGALPVAESHDTRRVTKHKLALPRCDACDLQTS